MNVVCFYPDEKGMEEIRKKINRIRAEAVIEFLNNANAFAEQCRKRCCSALYIGIRGLPQTFSVPKILREVAKRPKICYNI